MLHERSHILASTCLRALVAAWMMAACSTGESFLEAASRIDNSLPMLHVGQTEHFGLVVLTLTEDRNSAQLNARLTGNAWFVEHDAGRQDRVLDILEPLTLGAESLAVDASAASVSKRCTSSQRRIASRSSASTGPVYFMDAGELVLESDAGVVLFQSAYFPDVDPDIGGLVYDAHGPDARQLLNGTLVRLTGSGATEVGPFVVEIAPPAPLRLTQVGTAALLPLSTQGTRVNEGADGELLVTWLSARSTDAADSDTTVSVRYVRQGFDRVAAVTCRVPDTGRFAIPAEALATLPDMGADQTDRLEVARIRTSKFTAEGLSSGTAVIIARDTVLLDEQSTSP